MASAGEPPHLSFSGLLRQLRAEARLTQEELAAAARLSPRSVSDLERGINRTARRLTTERLAAALGLAGPQGELFVAAARGRVPAAQVLAARNGVPDGAPAVTVARALPRDIACYTGREAELKVLLALASPAAADGRGPGICAIDGMAGAGKTAFAVHAAHRLAPDFPDGQYFVPLHAHAPGQRPADPADALASLLLMAGMAARQVPSGLQARAGLWRSLVAGRRILLLLDDAAGHDQVRPLLPGSGRSLVLVTSRLRLTALEDAVVISLGTLSPDEASDLLARLAGRPDVVSGADAATLITRTCGYLPLAIGMLGRQLRHHPARSLPGLAADLAASRDRLAMMHAENLSVAAAFDLSYQDAGADAGRLFRRLGVLPGPDCDAYAAAALDATSVAAARRLLDELHDHHLITEHAPGRYVLHDLLREHARALADQEPETSAAAAGRLLDYYAHTALAAARQIPSWTPVRPEPPPLGHPPEFTPELSTLGGATEWMQAERANLHTAAEHAAARGLMWHAIQIPAAMGDFLRNAGDTGPSAALLRTGLAAARRAGDRAGQALALRNLGMLSWLSGDFRMAARSLAEAADLYDRAGDPAGQAFALNNLGWVAQLTADYPAAAASHQQALALARDAGDERSEALTLAVLGNSQRLAGDYPAAAASLTQALDLSRAARYRLGEATALANLGGLHDSNGDDLAAARCYQQALDMFRDLGERSFEATAIQYIGRIHMRAGDFASAAACLHEALTLRRDRGLRFDETETLNYLGELATRTGRTAEARDYHAAALAISRQAGMPLDEATALEDTGLSYLHDGSLAQASGCLHQALAIYQRVGAPDARRIQQTLHDHTLPAPGT